MWRDTMLAVRLGPFDARVLVTLLLWLGHMRGWTFIVALAGAADGVSLPGLAARPRRTAPARGPASRSGRPAPGR